MTQNGQLEPPPGSFVSPLLELRDYYARLTEEYERLFVQARSQLDHVEALLANWSFSDANNQISSLTLADETSDVSQEGPLRFLSPLDEIDEINLVESVQSELTDKDLVEIDNSFSAVDTKEGQPSTTSPDPKIAPENNDSSTKVAEIPMLPQYNHALSRMEAIKQLLQEQIGTVCHIDFIVRSLYGELDSNLFKVVKGRVQSSLTQGRERNYWVTIPDEPGCYTLDLSLVAPSKRNGASRSIKNKNKKPFVPPTKAVPMLKAFEGQFLIDALTSLLEENPGKVFSVAEVIAGIYGELDSQQLREVKNKVLNELSRGYRTGRFSRVPNQIGFYTWDSNMISEGSSR
ncbi:Cell division protein DamX, binds to the septal ring, containings C-terminal SPOR domain [Nostoc flagelliforme CCNUN1]|uniref:Cell division protein DamX, binds to the septal ring, containings C-terminal SPOR domain n=1 Tax=Nostoc flagelliforme CCNUN1 TaxID=2038116 RepID=A0A2K8SLD9_9NOSO|nr:hypothetical protein [Nostoc flagelliforme]AUB36170.1 Cell division protein DamX, binds to the septal ring, containings C-terminal SPOR domain [Nostoc flagelliforme CCNUN1]